jgi:hypothetical protein
MPGKFLEEKELAILDEKIRSLDPAHNIHYSVLNPELSASLRRDFYNKILVCLVYKKDQLVGFSYYFIFNKNPALVHLGLVYFARPSAPGIIVAMYVLAHYILYAIIGRHYVTNISHIPWVVGQVGRYYRHCWPTYKNYLETPPRNFARILRILEKRYIRKYYDNPDLVQIDYNKFIITEYASGFKREFSKLKMDRCEKVNQFCQSMIQYPNEEDIIQLARVGGWFDKTAYFPLYAPLVLFLKGFEYKPGFVFPKWSVLGTKEFDAKELES